MAPTSPKKTEDIPQPEVASSSKSNTNDTPKIQVPIPQNITRETPKSKVALTQETTKVAPTQEITEDSSPSKNVSESQDTVNETPEPKLATTKTPTSQPTIGARIATVKDSLKSRYSSISGTKASPESDGAPSSQNKTNDQTTESTTEKSTRKPKTIADTVTAAAKKRIPSIPSLSQTSLPHLLHFNTGYRQFDEICAALQHDPPEAQRQQIEKDFQAGHKQTVTVTLQGTLYQPPRSGVPYIKPTGLKLLRSDVMQGPRQSLVVTPEEPGDEALRAAAEKEARRNWVERLERHANRVIREERDCVKTHRGYRRKDSDGNVAGVGRGGG